MLLDTERERQYKIGRSYNYEPLKQGECIINEKWSQSLGVQEGDIVYMRLQIPNIMNAFVNTYNRNKGLNIRQVSNRDFIDLPCKVRNLMSSSNGKFPEENAGNINIIEYSQFTSLISDYLPSYLDIDEDFKAFLR